MASNLIAAIAIVAMAFCYVRSKARSAPFGARAIAPFVAMPVVMVHVHTYNLVMLIHRDLRKHPTPKTMTPPVELPRHFRMSALDSRQLSASVSPQTTGLAVLSP